MTLNRKSIRVLEKRLKKARPKLITKAKNVYDPLTATCQCEIHSEVQKNGIELGRVVQEGFDPDYISGIGNLLRVRIIEQCIEENIFEYDFLAGFTEHKRRWGSTERFGADMFIWNNKLKNAIFSLYRFWPSGRFLKLVH